MPQEAALSPRRRQGLAGRAASCGLSDTCLPLSSWQVDFTSCTGLFCVLAIVMVVTGIITAIVLAFKYVSVPAELGSVNPVLRADFLYISVWQAPWASDGSGFQNLSTVLRRHPLDWGIIGDPGPGSRST